MSDTEVWSRVRRSIQAALKLSDEAASGIGPEASAATLPEWTSMAHLELILAIERDFDVTFEADEIANLASAASIVAALERARV